MFLGGALIEEVERHGVQESSGKMRRVVALQDVSAANLLGGSEPRVDKIGGGRQAVWPAAPQNRLHDSRRPARRPLLGLPRAGEIKGPHTGDTIK